MIETKFIKEIVKEFQISEFIASSLKNVGFSGSKVQKTPLGEKIIIYASRPGLIVGRKGENIQKLTQSLKTKFKLENPQIEIIEVENQNLDPQIIAERIASSLERFGLSKFKGIGHKMLSDVMDAGAKGVEILMSGKIPSSRAKRWRFYQGYLKKSGDIAITGVKEAYSQAQLKTGTIGIQVKIMPPDLKLPDTINFNADEEMIREEVGQDKDQDDEKDKGKDKDKAQEKEKKAEAKQSKPVKEEKTKNNEEKKPDEEKSEEEILEGKPANEAIVVKEDIADDNTGAPDDTKSN